MATTTYEKLKPCPFCGYELPWKFISFTCCVLECRCGASLTDNAVQTAYHKPDLDNLPHLLPYATALEQEVSVITLSGDTKTCNDFWCVPADVAFYYGGVTSRWNKRTD